jgi:hypothetical protein
MQPRPSRHPFSGLARSTWRVGIDLPAALLSRVRTVKNPRPPEAGRPAGTDDLAAPAPPESAVQANGSMRRRRITSSLFVHEHPDTRVVADPLADPEKAAVAVPDRRAGRTLDAPAHLRHREAVHRHRDIFDLISDPGAAVPPAPPAAPYRPPVRSHIDHAPEMQPLEDMGHAWHAGARPGAQLPAQANAADARAAARPATREEAPADAGPRASELESRPALKGQTPLERRQERAAARLERHRRFIESLESGQQAPGRADGAPSPSKVRTEPAPTEWVAFTKGPEWHAGPEDTEALADRFGQGPTPTVRKGSGLATTQADTMLPLTPATAGGTGIQARAAEAGARGANTRVAWDTEEEDAPFDERMGLSTPEAGATPSLSPATAGRPSDQARAAEDNARGAITRGRLDSDEEDAPYDERLGLSMHPAGSTPSPTPATAREIRSVDAQQASARYRAPDRDETDPTRPVHVSALFGAPGTARVRGAADMPRAEPLSAWTAAQGSQASVADDASVASDKTVLASNVSVKPQLPQGQRADLDGDDRGPEMLPRRRPTGPGA